MTNLGLAASDLQAIGRDNAVGAAAFESAANRNCPARLYITGYSQLLSGSDDSDLVGVASSHAGHSTSEIGPLLSWLFLLQYASEPERFRREGFTSILLPYCGRLVRKCKCNRRRVAAVAMVPGQRGNRACNLSADASPQLVTFV